MKALAERRSSARPNAELNCVLNAVSSCSHSNSEPDHVATSIP